jgi:ribose transport system substrate-binding protein
MISAWKDVASQAKAAGEIGSYRVETTAQNTATAQIAQIDSLILSHVNAIDIDSASPTALNPAIEDACKAGIKVVVFDSLASAPCEYNLSDPFATWGAATAQDVVNALHGHGNVILVQAVVGSQPNAVAVAAQEKVLKSYPGIHVLSTSVVGNGDAGVESALESVLPSMPTVNGVVLQGGAAGAIAAFQALGRPIPVITFSSDGLSLRAWSKLHSSGAALGTDPGQGSAAFWETVLLLQGKSVPHQLTWPIITITPSTLSQWIKVTPSGNFASWIWTLAEVEAGIIANRHGKVAAVPPIPTRAP